MPELAEVEYFRRRWDVGQKQRVLAVETHAHARIYRQCPSDLLHQHLIGTRLSQSWAHGKQMLFHFSPGCWLGLHLGMTGDMRAESPDYRAAKHDHLVLRQKHQALVFADSRMFGKITLDVSSHSPPAWWQQLAPDLLSDRFSIEWLSGALQRRKNSPIKAVLLDQSICAGVGNWMADEILWRSHLWPLQLTGSLSSAELTLLYEQIRLVARVALERISENWGDLPIGWLYHARWASDTPCPRCGLILIREEAAGRTTCWCPGCQPPTAGLIPPVFKIKRSGSRRESPHK